MGGQPPAFCVNVCRKNRRFLESTGLFAAGTNSLNFYPLLRVPRITLANFQFPSPQTNKGRTAPPTN